MAVDYGKEWETKFSDQWQASFPTYILERLHDQVSGYKTVSQNPADYYAFVNNKLVYLECKETKEGTLNFSKFPQLDRMLDRVVNYENVAGYVVIWFRKHKRVIVVDVMFADKIRQAGNASISLASIDKKLYNILEVDTGRYIIEIPTKTSMVYPKCDFKIMSEVI